MVALLVVAPLLAACENTGLTGQATPATAPTATPTAANLLELASQRLASTPSVHFNLEVEGETFIDSARTIRLLGAEGDLERPDRVRTSFKAEVLGRAVTMQLITVGNQSWTTNILTGAWGPAPPEFAYRPTILFDNQNGIGPVMGRVQGAKRMDDDEINGRQTYHIVAEVDESVTGPLTYGALTGSPVTVDLWIDQESDDLLRARLAEPPGAGREHPATWTLDLSKHGEKVSIEPPPA